jgi:enolase
MELYVPLINSQILPVGASSFTEAMKMGSEVYHHLKSIINKKYGQGKLSMNEYLTLRRD